MKQEFVTLPREVVEQAQMWIPLLAEIAGLDPETTTAEFSEFADGRPASELTIANVITALRAALEQPQNHVPDAGNMVPAGWKLVPVEPTQEMLDQLRFGWSDISTAQIIDRWKRTVDAAPQPPTVKECLTVEQPQANQPAMTPIAQRKLDSLLTDGYAISGYSVYHERKHQHGFVTGAGLVGWWKPDGAEYPQPKQEPLTDEQIFALFESVWTDGTHTGLVPPMAIRLSRAIEAAHNIK